MAKYRRDIPGIGALAGLIAAGLLASGIQRHEPNGTRAALATMS